MELLSLAALKKAAADRRVPARIHVQVESLLEKQTRDLKPYWELVVADAEAKITLRAWNDSEAFAQCGALSRGTFIEITGEFTQNASFGPEARQWTCRRLTDEERDTLLAGPADMREKQAADYASIVSRVASVEDPRLRSLAGGFLDEFGERFRRTAAARNYHHARRGGLVEHVAQMIRCADSICSVYTHLNRDLLVTGCLMHDIGKLWENSLPENGFVMAYDEKGELLGHITIGIEVLNALWRKLLGSSAADGWQKLNPPSEDVRMHLLHLIAAHHGSLAFGSPVDPKTPEAHALHYIDNLDAKLEMIWAGYRNAPAIAARILERVRPLPGNLVLPLPAFIAAEPRSGT
jgi:3'-5' exoribonuclease